MPSDLNVIAVRVPPERLKAVKRISGACGMSMSSWINSILDEAIPMSERAMRAAVMAEAGQEEFIQHLRQSLAAAQDAVSKIEAGVSGGEGSGAAGGVLPRAQVGRTSPPPTNRGVTNGG